ncbi:zinc-dependent peptidase [Candidatus Reidiella endopervernicosa]|uniref:M90 family metallopeptidase n=1 Tax=Candidatus Reidiella endopervernicosa TaxID=2738883 RepID=UPI001F4140C1|nr:M90 family metallopeptidase [Candidatus Reidiella endopervernicosa]
MFEFIHQWLARRIINKSTISDDEWSHAFAALPLLNGLNEEEQSRLQELTILLMRHKSFEGAQGLVLTQPMMLHIALQACLPILNLGLSAYDGWVSVIVYPAAFVPVRSYTDEAGVVHQGQVALAGEAWQRGPLILGWHEVERGGEIDGHNVVIHEFVHKLDMLNGAADGFPPLHAGKDVAEWTEAFTRAYDHFQKRCHNQTYRDIDCYAATSPPEFFAVFSEVFFERPELLKQHYSDVYEQLRATIGKIL